ncbi:MAG TPA: DedA family protein [Terriglobales bacterium]|nr:DedA family protein [Terriglobales bacterium]
MGHIFDVLRGYLVHYGYWTVAAVLLLENAGVPVPGETILLAAAFLAHSDHRLRVPYLILVGTCAATFGDNVGYAIGHYGGRRVLERYREFFHISREHVARGERLFARYGAPTILFARFVFGMRVIAGPLAGVLRMHWKKFAVFNAIGATLWVSTITMLGYLAGKNSAAVVKFLREADYAIVALVVVVGLYLWWRQRKNPREKTRVTDSANHDD